MPIERLSIQARNGVRRILILVLALAISLVYSACQSDNRITGSVPSDTPTAIVTQQVDLRRISIRIADRVVAATLIDSPTSRDFVALLPLTLTLEDYAETEKINVLPKKLSIEAAPSGSDPTVGDIAYYAPWGNLAIFYQDFGYSNGLIILGKIDGDIEALSTPGSIEATIELVP